MGITAMLHCCYEREYCLSKAMVLFERVFRQQMRGEFGDAVELYESSLLLHLTAEATRIWLDLWHDGSSGRAIEECEKAPSLIRRGGNPYNDIGSYLIENGVEKLLPWLEKALVAGAMKHRSLPFYQFWGVSIRISADTALHLTIMTKHWQFDPLNRMALNLNTLLGRLNWIQLRIRF